MSKLKKTTVTVDYLNTLGNDIQITNATNDLLKVIDDKILESHAAGLNEAKCEVPYNFEIRNMDPYDAQLIIYTNCMENLEERGFTTKYYTSPPNDKKPSTYIIVRWKAKLSADRREKYKKFIAERSIKEMTK